MKPKLKFYFKAFIFSLLIALLIYFCAMYFLDKSAFIALYKEIFSHKILFILFIITFLMAMGMYFIYSHRFAVEGQKKEQMKKLMSKYISEDIMKNVMKNMDGVELGGKKAQVTILLTDIRDFTSISEELSAEEVTEILNEYFSLIEPIIRKHGGYLNKFIGDAILAVFGEPVKNNKHAVSAVKCAHEILKKIRSMQTNMLAEGKPKINVGIGISTGETFIGHIGTKERFEYTVIGSTVNLASRIESYNRVYKTQFLICENTYEQIQGIADVIKISDVRIRGKSKSINIYEVLRISE